MRAEKRRDPGKSAGVHSERGGSHRRMENRGATSSDLSFKRPWLLWEKRLEGGERHAVEKVGRVAFAVVRSPGRHGVAQTGGG